jgi:transposase
VSLIVVQAYRFALDPTPRQEADLRRHCGAARVAFNWGLALIKANLDQRHAERSQGTTENDLTPSLSWSMYSLRKTWNQAKAEVAPWWAQCSKETYATGLTQLATALANWSELPHRETPRPPDGVPRFKSKRRASLSCRFTTGPIRVEPDRHHVTLPVLGTIKAHESTRKTRPPARGPHGETRVGHGPQRRGGGWCPSPCTSTAPIPPRPGRRRCSAWTSG